MTFVCARSSQDGAWSSWVAQKSSQPSCPIVRQSPLTPRPFRTNVRRCHTNLANIADRRASFAHHRPTFPRGCATVADKRASFAPPRATLPRHLRGSGRDLWGHCAPSFDDPRRTMQPWCVDPRRFSALERASCAHELRWFAIVLALCAPLAAGATTPARVMHAPTSQADPRTS
jgi:hypothetical protein